MGRKSGGSFRCVSVLFICVYRCKFPPFSPDPAMPVRPCPGIRSPVYLTLSYHTCLLVSPERENAEEKTSPPQPPLTHMLCASIGLETGGRSGSRTRKVAVGVA